jgi:hypothetical protein
MWERAAMKPKLARILGLLTMLLAAAPAARAQQIPPVHEGEPIVRTTMENNRLRMVDLQNNFDIILPGGTTFANFAPGVTGDVRLQEQPDGFDLIYTFTNTGGQPARLGRLSVGKFNLGNNIDYRDFRHIGEPVRVDYNNYAFQAFPYPHGMYSPVWLLQNDQYAIGMSIQYPVLDYKHDARLMLGSTPADAPASHGPRGWFVEFRLANLGDEPEMGRLRWPGTVPPGESRTYVVSVRVTKTPSDWIRTLTPYRDYFHGMYGGVRYQRDARPVRPVLMALDHLIAADNPYGYENFQNKRPDLYGFRPWTDHLKRSKDQFPRVMLWAPSGLYNENRQSMNYPFQFTSRWDADPRMSNYSDPEVGLASLGREGMTLGLWWGRSVQVAREWNTAQWEALDPNNPAHVQAAFAEMDHAAQAGATEIGLDTFNAAITPIWDLVPWMERMIEAYPQMKFISEPICNDIMHRLGPTFVIGWTTGAANRPEDLCDINNPLYLADLLLPGHETWGAFSYHRHRSRGFPVTPEIVQRDMERIAGFGFVPVMMDDPPSPGGVRAAESWIQSIPADVLRGSGWPLSPARPRAMQRPDGQWIIVGDGGAMANRPTQGQRQVSGMVAPRPGAVPDRASRVAGSVPTRPGTNPQAAAPVAGADAGVEPDALEESADPPAAIERAKRKVRVDLRIQHDGSADRIIQPAAAEEIDLPGSRVNVPGSTSKGKGKGRGVSPAWLEALARKGYVNTSEINRAAKELPASGGVKVLPSTRK